MEEATQEVLIVLYKHEDTGQQQWCAYAGGVDEAYRESGPMTMIGFFECGRFPATIEITGATIPSYRPRSINKV